MATMETYRVQGMTCDHCIAAVKGQLTRLAGVTAVDIDLSTGAVVVTSDGPLAAEAVRSAVDEAGYEFIS